jgi:predicted nucleic acid-binding protein
MKKRLAVLMNASPRVVLDACVLANFGLCDLLLTLAETPRLYQPVWNREILNEVQRTQVGKLAWPEALSKSWRKAVESAFPEAMVTGHEALLELCANHEKDRHVLATAIRGHAELIVTSNLKHFPAEALKPWDVSACHPADFLITLYSLNAGAVVARLEEIARKRKRAPQEHLAFLGRSVPAFASHVAEAVGWELPDAGA